MRARQAAPSAAWSFHTAQLSNRPLHSIAAYDASARSNPAYASLCPKNAVPRRGLPRSVEELGRARTCMRGWEAGGRETRAVREALAALNHLRGRGYLSRPVLARRPVQYEPLVVVPAVPDLGADLLTLPAFVMLPWVPMAHNPRTTHIVLAPGGLKAFEPLSTRHSEN